MSLDGKLLSHAREIMHDRKIRHEATFRQQREALYTAHPNLQAIDEALQKTVRDVIRLTITESPNLEAHLAEIGEQNQALQAESRALLVKAGYQADYLDDKPMCLVCKDVGHHSAGLCNCLLSIYRTLQAKELSDLLNINQENFEAFSLTYYDDRTIDPRFGLTARDNMEINYQICHKYATAFGSESGNLLLTGAPGLGKTFLSSCLAKTVLESGFSVVYDTAAGLFSKFEAEKFGHRNDHTAAQSEVQRYLNCDLLILDDLGTEMTTNFTISALYTLINTRLLQKKQTVINTNFSLDELATKYSTQIMSRLEGEYERLTFFGQDIRKLKKNFN